MSLLNGKFAELIKELNDNQSDLKKFFNANEKLHSILFSKNYAHIPYDQNIHCTSGNKVIRLYSHQIEVITLKKSLINSDFKINVFEKIQSDEDLSITKTKVFCIKKVADILSEKESKNKKTMISIVPKSDNMKNISHELSKNSALLDEKGFITNYALIKGFIQKEEILLEDESQISKSIFQPKKLVSVVLAHHQSQYIVYYINDANNIRKCREVDGFGEAKEIYKEFLKEMSSQDWINLYWKSKVSYLN